MKRNLDEIYFRTPNSDGEFENICFSDLTTEQREYVMEGRSEEWLKALCQILANTINRIGKEFNIVRVNKNSVPIIKK